MECLGYISQNLDWSPFFGVVDQKTITSSLKTSESNWVTPTMNSSTVEWFHCQARPVDILLPQSYKHAATAAWMSCQIIDLFHIGSEERLRETG